MRRAILTVAAATLIGASAGASGAIITRTFDATGVTDSLSRQASATFSLDTANPNTFSIELTDNVNPTASILSVLDGISFSLSQPVTSISLVSVTPTSVIDCSADPACPTPNPAPTDPTLGWGATLSGGKITLGAGFDSSSSSFAYQPFGIVNANFSGTDLASAGNPLLVGPVRFTFSTDMQAFPEIMGVSFLFGTVPDVVTAAVPEPQSLALLGIALIAGWSVRSRVLRKGEPKVRVA